MSNVFHPDPVLPGWNYNFLDGSDTWWRCIWDYRIFNRFADAVKERFEAMVPWEAPQPFYRHATSGDFTLARWKELYNGFIGWFYENFFDGATNDTLAPTDPGLSGPTPLEDGSSNADPNFFVLRPSATYGSSLPQNFPIGYLVDLSSIKAYYPREITSLTSPGTNGQYARFIGPANTPGNGTAFAQIFLRSGGVWTYHSARSTVTSTANFGFPDKVERVGVYDASDPGFTGPTPIELTAGDYFCPEWLQAFRDLINNTVVFWHDNCGEARTLLDPIFAWTPYWSSEGADSAAAGGGSNEASTDISFFDPANRASYDRPQVVPFVDVQWLDDGSGAFFVGEKQRWCGYPKIDNLPKPTNTRQLTFYIAPALWLDVEDSFATFGDNVSDRAWENVGSASVSGTSYVGSKFGTLATAPTGTKPGDSAILGYAVNNTIGAGVFVYSPTIGVVSRWDVSGGFNYTAST